MISLFSIINTIIFLLIALLHFYWAFGGKWGIAAAMPVPLKGHSMSLIMTLATIVVAVGLLGFAFIALLNYNNFFDVPIPPHWITRLTAIIGFIFLARAIGDFNYCGLFRKIKEGVFAEGDRKIYTPLCLYLAVSMLLLSYSS